MKNIKYSNSDLYTLCPIPHMACNYEYKISFLQKFLKYYLIFFSDTLSIFYY